MTTSVQAGLSASRSARKIYVLGDVHDISQLVLLDAVVHGEPVQILAGPGDSGRAEILAQQIERSGSLERWERKLAEREDFPRDLSGMRRLLRTLSKACVESAKAEPSDNLPYYRRFERRSRWR